MAVLTRLETITEAKIRIGRMAQTLDLTYSYDAIVQLVSTKYPLIPHQRTAGSCTGSQAYIASPSVNIRRPEKMMVGIAATSLSEIEWYEPELFIAFKGASNAIPTKWTYMRDQTTPFAVLQPYFYPTPDTTHAYAFYYSVINAKSSADGYQHSMTEYMDESVVLGVMWKGLELIEEFGKALIQKGLFLKDLDERARTITKSFKTVE